MDYVKRHTYDSAIIGNCQYLAYVGRKRADVQWLCWPRFDSSFIFGGLLDSEKGGEFAIFPANTKYESSQYYLRNTNILVTEFKAKDGAFRVIDFAPRYEHHSRIAKPLQLIRKIELLEGSPQVVINCRPRYDYGEKKLTATVVSNHIRYDGLEAPIRLYSDLSLNHITQSDPFVLNSSAYISLLYGGHLDEGLPLFCEEGLYKTKTYWESWIKRSSMPLRNQKDIIRSLLALKLHQYEDTGGVIAAGTTSLPESPGEERNWDYRYCWLRDTYYTLSAFNSTAHFTEMLNYAGFIQNISAVHEDYQPLYSICGQSKLTEEIIPLKGYADKYAPVRVGNLAYEQKQYDVYGQIILSLLSFYFDERLPDTHQPPPLSLFKRLIDLIDKTLEAPDAGIWEFRGFEKLHTHTLLFHWAGAKGVARIAVKKGDSALANKANKLVERASSLIEKCYDPKRKVYTSALGDPTLDASSFLLVTMNYLDPKSDRARDHVRELAKELADENGFVFRYRHKDDFGEMTVAFCICGFWYAEALAFIGELDKAQEVFDNHVKYANHVGLMSEDIDPKNGSQWGNFPQTYSHVGLIHCAFTMANIKNRPLFFEDENS